MWHFLGCCLPVLVAFAVLSDDDDEAAVTFKTVVTTLSADTSRSNFSSVDSEGAPLALRGAVGGVPGMPWGENLKATVLRSAGWSGKGSFGEAWQLKNVVLKFFHADNKYLIGRDLTGKLESKIRENIFECEQTHRIVALARGSSLEWQQICDCYEEHISDAIPYDPLFIVMQDCGQDLGMAMRNGKIDTLEKVRYVIKQILKAIDTLSAMNYVHHDLKPANVAYDDNGNVRLIDFGGLLKFDRKKPPRTWTFTEAYAPPESKKNAYDVEADASAFDCYAAGLIYWQLLCQINVPPKRANDQFCETGKFGIGESADFQIILGLTKKAAKARLGPRAALERISKAQETVRVVPGIK